MSLKQSVLQFFRLDSTNLSFIVNLDHQLFSNVLFPATRSAEACSEGKKT